MARSATSEPSEDDLVELENFVSGLYIEVDKLAKKAPALPLSDFATTRENRALQDARRLLGSHDKYAADFAPFVESGENPEVRDALLALREVKQAIGRVEQKLGYGLLRGMY